MATTLDMKDYLPGWNDVDYDIIELEANIIIGDADTDYLRMYSAAMLQFRDTALKIYSSTDGQLDIVADTTIALSGAMTTDGTLTMTVTDESAPFVMTNTITTAATVGARALFNVKTNVAMGSYTNALKGYWQATGTSASTTGLASGVCAELKTPNRTLPSGAYYSLELEHVSGGTSVVSTGSGSKVGFIYAAFSGDTDGDFDDNGYFMTVTDLTAGAGHMLSADSHSIKINIDSSTKYMVLSSSENTLHLSDDVTVTLGTTTATAATKITAVFDETTTGIGLIKLGTTSAPMVMNTDPGAGGVNAIDVNVTHSAGAGDCVWFSGVQSGMIISGDGDLGSKLSAFNGSTTVSGAVSSCYTVWAKATHASDDTVSGAMAALNADLYITTANFTASQTLQTAIFTLRSDQARTVTCASENMNVVLIKNTSAIAGVNALLKLVNSGSDNPAAIIHVEGAGDNAFIQFDSGSNCEVDTGAPGNNASHKIKCRYDNTTFYLAGYASI